jgi:hypothetical protein
MFTIVMAIYVEHRLWRVLFFSDMADLCRRESALEVKAAQTEKDKSMMKYHQLKNQG